MVGDDEETARSRYLVGVYDSIATDPVLQNESDNSDGEDVDERILLVYPAAANRTKRVRLGSRCQPSSPPPHYCEARAREAEKLGRGPVCSLLPL